MQTNRSLQRWPWPALRHGLTAGLALFYLSILAALLWAGYCAFTHGLFRLVDYGRYTNMIWNSGRGEFFRFLIDQTYLLSHLSFSLALLGPLFYVWNDPFLLSVVQWLFVSAGSLLLGAGAWRLGLNRTLIVGLLVWYAGYVFTQSVHLSEFHGISGNLVLIPWLYYCLHRARRLAWIPLVLTLGLREEAGLVVVPLLVYHAVAYRWKPGYFLALAALGYSLLAVFVIYPSIANHTIFAQHGGKSDLHSILASLSAANSIPRLKALALVILPMLPFARRAPVPLLVIPSVAVLMSLGSGWHHQFAMELQHPAPVMACMAVAMVEAAAIAKRRSGTFPRDLVSRVTEIGGEEQTLPRQSPAPAGPAWAAVYLAVLTAVINVAVGFLPGSRSESAKFYLRPSDIGIQTLWVARHAVPRDGVLVTNSGLAGFVANRAELITWDTLKPAAHRVDVIFDKIGRFPEKKANDVRERLANREFGARFFDGNHLVLQRGWDPALNDRVLAEWGRPVIRFAWTKLQDRGKNLYLPGSSIVRFWKRGSRHREPMLSCDASVRLEPGDYVAEFILRAEPAEAAPTETWGTLSLHAGGGRASLAEAAIRPTPAGGDFFHVQRVPFRLPEGADVEPRVTGGDATLWLDRVVFLPSRGEGE
jgi:uncharacterized membrane protein